MKNLHRIESDFDLNENPKISTKEFDFTNNINYFSIICMRFYQPKHMKINGFLNIANNYYW